MSEVEERALQAFGPWLSSLADDARAIVDVIADEAVPAEVRRPLVASLNYLFKSLDLIDDGIEGLGYLDDAFVLRIAAVQAGSVPESLSSLAGDAALVKDVLGDLAPRLECFVAGLGESTVRGRSVQAIVDDAAVREDFIGDLRGWASRYEAPAFVADDKSLVKLRSFLAAKLPR